MDLFLRGESKHEWKLQLSRIETSLDSKIEDVLTVVYRYRWRKLRIAAAAKWTTLKLRAVATVWTITKVEATATTTQMEMEIETTKQKLLRSLKLKAPKPVKHTGCWSWFRKHGLRKKKLNKTEQTSCKIS